MVRTTCAFFVLSLLSLGCASTPLDPVDILVNPPESITITGQNKLPDKVIHVNNSDEVKKIVRLINQIRGGRRSQLNFEPSEVESFTIEIHQGSNSTELGMVVGRMVDPHVEHSLFYESEHNAELWDLMIGKLRSAK